MPIKGKTSERNISIVYACMRKITRLLFSYGVRAAHMSRSQKDAVKKWRNYRRKLQTFQFVWGDVLKGGEKNPVSIRIPIIRERASQIYRYCLCPRVRVWCEMVRIHSYVWIFTYIYIYDTECSVANSVFRAGRFVLNFMCFFFMYTDGLIAWRHLRAIGPNPVVNDSYFHILLSQNATQ